MNILDSIASIEAASVFDLEPSLFVGVPTKHIKPMVELTITFKDGRVAKLTGGWEWIKPSDASST